MVTTEALRGCYHTVTLCCGAYINFKMKKYLVHVCTFSLLFFVFLTETQTALGLVSKCEEGAFINLCGFCVGGSTGLQDLEGKDKCDICLGSNECLKCNDQQGCKMTSFPSIFDLALAETKVKLYLQTSKFKENVENIICSVTLVDGVSAEESPKMISLIFDAIPYLQMDLSDFKTGSYLVVCKENANSNKIDTAMKIVDSRNIKITAVNPSSVTSSIPFKVTLNISAPIDMQNFVCFIKSDGLLVSVANVKSVSHGVIECGPMVVYGSIAAFLGVSGTLTAALERSSNLNMVELTISPFEPQIKRSTFSSDLRLIFVQFDQNLNTSTDCRKAFSPETISLFGKGWQCFIRADQIVIQLGSDPVIHPGSRISLASRNDIQRSSSNFQGSTTVVDDITNQVVEPVYNVLAPRVACSDKQQLSLQTSFFARKMQRDGTKQMMSDGNSVTILEVQPLGGQNLLYNWSVGFTPPNNRRPLSQRDMLMTWLSVRMLDKSVKAISSNRISLNNSLMLSNVDYTVTVRGTNALGMSGEEKHIPVRLQEVKSSAAELRSMGSEDLPSACASGAPLDVMISSSPATFSDVDFRTEASTSCCDGRINSDILGQVGYVWSVKSYNGTKINVGSFQGKYLNIPAGTFHGGEHYKISCELLHKTLNITLGLASTSIVTLERGIKSNVNVSSVGISTRHPLIIDASSSVDLDNKRVALQFEWKCRIINTEPEIFGYGDNQCYIPSQKKALLHDTYAGAFKKPILHLPPGSLYVGRYQFSVQVSRILEVNKLISGVTTIEVSVLGGSPPLVFIPARNSASNDNLFLHVVNPDEGVTLTGVVTGIKAGCHISWKGVDQPGYITINQSLLHTETYTSIRDFDKPREFSAELSPGMIGDAKYRFRLSALCPTSGNLSFESSFADVDVFTDAPPVVKPLNVDPLEGEALVTEFRFSTQQAYDDLLDYPLRYSFGFQILEEGSNPSAVKYFHSSNQKLSASTYLPATSLTTTKIKSLLRVCDVRQICRIVDGPIVLSNAPKELTPAHVEHLSDGFSSFLMTEEYEDAIMLVESSMITLEVLDDKSLYQLASKKVEKAVNSQLDLFERRLNSSPEEVNAALRFLKAANAALKHGVFTQETLQRLVAFKDKILGMLNEDTRTMSDQSSSRKRRDAQMDTEQPRNILQPEMVRTLLSVSEVAIFNLSDTEKALDEKRKLLHNVSFFMDALCRGLRNSVPLFIGSRVVSFSIQRLNIQIKYKDDLAIPDWRSSKSGGTPVNATAQIRLGEDMQQLLGGSIVCMGAAFYPLDILSEVTQISIPGSFRHSSVYYVKIIQNTSQKITAFESYNDGFDVKKQTVKIKIPIWNDQIKSGFHLECWVWSHGTWDKHSCKFGKLATLINKPAVECLCSIVGYHAIFTVESSLSTTSLAPATIKTSTSSIEFPTTASLSPVIPTTKVPLLPLPTEKTTTTGVVSTKVATVGATMETRTTTLSSIKEIPAALPAGIPVSNTSKNFTFRIQEEFSDIVGTDEEAFISQLKRDILKQVDMPSNMIASIEIAPGSILVTLHLVDTDIRTVDDVLPSLAAVLQDGCLSVNSVDGRHLSVPPQKLKLLLHRSESSFVPWIIIGCSGFGLFSIGSLIIAAIIVKRQMRDLDFTDNTGSPEITNKTPSYGRFHLEQTLDGSEATLSRYRGSVNNPLVVSTIGGLASVMGTNALLPTDHVDIDSQFMLQPPQSDNRNIAASLYQHRSSENPSTSSGNTSGSSDNSIQKRIRNGAIARQSSRGLGNYIDCETEEEDSGIVLNGRVTTGLSPNSRNQTPEAVGQRPPDVRILPGTPTGRGDGASSQGGN